MNKGDFAASFACCGVNPNFERNKLCLLTGEWESQFKYTFKYNFAVQKFHHDGSVSCWIG